MELRLRPEPEYRVVVGHAVSDAAILLAPYYALIGLWWGRRRRVQAAALAGAVTALVGFEIVTVLRRYGPPARIPPRSLRSGCSSVWLCEWSPWWEAFCGLAGGRLAHPASIIRSMRRSSG